MKIYGIHIETDYQSNCVVIKFKGGKTIKIPMEESTEIFFELYKIRQEIKILNRVFTKNHIEFDMNKELAILCRKYL